MSEETESRPTTVSAEKRLKKRLENCLLKDPNLTEEHCKVILQSFSVFDENGDGKISKRELVRAYRIAGFNPTNQEVDALIKQHDLNGTVAVPVRSLSGSIIGIIGMISVIPFHSMRAIAELQKKSLNSGDFFLIMNSADDGYIDFEEYFGIMKAKMINLDYEKERMITAFKVLDLDNDGYITAKELEHALSQSGDRFSDKEISDIIKMADTNQDGKIDYNEFVEAELCKTVF